VPAGETAPVPVTTTLRRLPIFLTSEIYLHFGIAKPAAYLDRSSSNAGWFGRFPATPL
jgi:hypothetical protein